MKKLIDLILYGNFWIAFCAVAMGLQTHFILNGKINLTSEIGFIGAATFLLYALHKIIGIRKMKAFRERGRFAVISKYRPHIIVYSILGGLSTLWFFWQLPFFKKSLVIIPAIFALGYVIPLPKWGLRFRDIHYVKIFLVAFVWAWVTVFLPVSAKNWSELGPYLPMFLERAAFIFAITLPFDIRDTVIDKAAGLQTLPQQLGISNTKLLIAAALIIALLLSLWNYDLGLYSVSIVAALGFHYGITFAVSHFSDRYEHDYYFSGLIDGLMILQFIFVYLATGPA